MNVFNRLLANTLPYIPKQWVWPFAKPYVAGEKRSEALSVVASLNQQGCVCTLDFLGEAVFQETEADLALEEYEALLKEIAENRLKTNISVKLTQFGLLLSEKNCLERLRRLVKLAETMHNFVRIDMEDASCTESTLKIYHQLRQEFPNVGVVLQSRLRRTLNDNETLLKMGISHIRLCKGIYLEPRSIAYTNAELIRKNYVAILKQSFASGGTVGIATHDECLVWEAEQLIRKYQVPKEQFEFQMLLGVDSQLRNLLVQQGYTVRVYVPYGAQWHAYSLRRMRENPLLAYYILKNLVTAIKKI